MGESILDDATKHGVDPFDTPENTGSSITPDTSRGPKSYYEAVLKQLRDDTERPDARRGRYYLPNPLSGKTKGWQRVTNFVKLTDDTYHLDLWKQRNVVVGIARMLGAPIEYGFRTNTGDTIEHLARLDVKADKERLDNIAYRAQDVADAHKMSDAGTVLHLATEVADYMSGDVSRILPEHLAAVRLYLDARAVNGLAVTPSLVERVTASDTYEVAGKLDRIYGLRDGSYVIGDLKTGDSLDFAFPSIAAQLECYADGVNNVGIFDGQRYDRSIKVRTDFGIVVHLPSTRNEVTVYAVDLSKGRIINATNLAVRDTRRIKAKDVAKSFGELAELFGPALSRDELDQHWLEQMNGAHTREQLVSVAERARCFGQWNERLAGQARIIAAELAVAS